MRRDVQAFGLLSILALTFSAEPAASDAATGEKPDGPQVCALPQRSAYPASPQTTIPDLDPSTGASVLSLLIGGTIVLSSRERLVRAARRRRVPTRVCQPAHASHSP